MRLFKLISLMVVTTTMITACDDGSFSDVLDAGTTAQTQDVITCSISSTIPSTATLKVNASGGTQNFVIAGVDPACEISWKLNGVALAGTEVAETIASSQLTDGIVNTLQVTVTKGASTETHTWGISKNNAPTCAWKNPATNPAQFTYSTPQSLAAIGNDPDGDSLSNFVWKYDDVSVPARFSAVSTTAPGSNAVFTSIASGIHKVSVSFSDGYDTGECSWTMDMIGGCSISSSLPGSPQKMAFTGGSQTYSIVSANTSCTNSWTLNGAPLAGTGISQLISSSQLTGASNTLVATVTNGVSTDTMTWTIARNSVPACSSKTPVSSTPSAFNIGSGQSFTANAADGDSDSLGTFTWKFNDAINAGLFTGTTNGTNTSSTTFTATSSQVGTSQKVSAVFSDGYDTGECSWTMPIQVPCTIPTAYPNTATVKMAQAGSTSQTFIAAPNDSSCTVTWTLGGFANGTASSINTITSNDLASGGGAANVLIATATNGTSTATKTWQLIRNQVPTCSVKSPVGDPAAFAYTVGTNVFSGTAADADGDTLSGFTWKFKGNANPTSIYTSLSPASPTTSQSMTFVPTITQVGAGVLSLAFTDGVDTGSCDWNLNVTNPNTISLTGCSPSGSSAGSRIVVSSTGAGSTQNLQIGALNASSYTWQILSGATGLGTASTYAVTADGTYTNLTYRATALDADSNSVTCDFYVKKNGPPVVATSSPAPSQTWRVNMGSTLTFSATATDPNSDTLSYTWKVDGSVQTSYLNSTTSTATFSPGNTDALVTANNPHTISVEISDGSESVTQSWTVEVNNFSDECNTLLNGSVAAQGGKICTLSGMVGVGSGRVPAADQSRIRIQPLKVIEDAYGNWFISDGLNHTVSFWNRTGRSPFDGTYACGAANSTCSVSAFGKTASGAATAGDTGGLVVLTGNGSGGLSDEDSFNTSSKLNFLNNNGTVNAPYLGGIAFDAAEKFLYIADAANDRVVRLDGRTGATLGQVKTVFGAQAGGTAPTNTTPGNTDGNNGTTHVCSRPADVLLAGTSPNKYLYVTCYSSHVVKRMKADFSGADSANYGKGYNFVGGLVGGVSTWSPTDGAIGSGYGAARTIYPGALAKDSNNNIYWTEGAQGGTPTTGGRVRVYNNTGSTLTLFNGAPSTTWSTVSVFATEHTTASLASGKAGHANSVTLNYGSAITVTSPASAAPTRVRITGPAAIQTGTCAEFRMTALNASGALVVANASTAVGVTIAGGTGDLYNNNTCTTSAGVIGGAAGSRTVTLVNGTSETVFYYKNTASEARGWTITNANGITNAGFNGGALNATNAVIVTVTSYAALGAPDHIQVFNPLEMNATGCAPVKVQMQVITTNAPAAVTADRYFRLSTNAFGSFYSDSGCTTPSTSLTILNGTSEATLYYKPNINIPAGEVGSILGFSNVNTNNPTSSYPTTNTSVAFGQMAFNQPRGLAVYETGGTVKGFFVASYNTHRVHFINNTNASITIGSNPVAAYSGSLVLGGNAAGADAAGPGVATRINTPAGVAMTYGQDGLLVADYNNYRVRKLDVTGNNVSDLLGSNFGRSGSVGAAITRTNEMYYSSPSGLALDNSTRKLYISDSGNKYIRVLDLLQGKVDTYAGNNNNNLAPNDGSTPTLISVNAPKGMTLHDDGAGKKFLLYVDSNNAVSATTGLHNDNSNGATDQFCLVGGFNLSSTAKAPFTGASTVNAGRFFTAVGNQGLGCAPYGTTTYSTNALSSNDITLFNPEAVTSDGTNIYVTNRQDHCILKVAADGSTTVVVGTGTGTNVRCHQTSTTAIAAPTATTTAGQASSASVTIRFPTAIVIDPRYAADGNFFFADSPDVNGGSVIRYANFRTTSVTVGNITVNGSAVAGEPYVKTITFVQYMNPTSTGGANYGWVNGMAAVTASGVTQLCISGGRQDNAMLGSHNITCYAISTASPATSRIIGGTPTTALDVRSGAPLGNEQEGILSDDPAVKLFAPYGMAFDSDGNLYFAERGSHTVRFVRRWW